MADKTTDPSADTVGLVMLTFTTIALISQMRSKNLIETDRFSNALRDAQKDLKRLYPEKMASADAIMKLVDKALGVPDGNDGT